MRMMMTVAGLTKVQEAESSVVIHLRSRINQRRKRSVHQPPYPHTPSSGFYLRINIYQMHTRVPRKTQDRVQCIRQRNCLEFTGRDSHSGLRVVRFGVQAAEALVRNRQSQFDGVLDIPAYYT